VGATFELMRFFSYLLAGTAAILLVFGYLALGDSGIHEESSPTIEGQWQLQAQSTDSSGANADLPRPPRSKDEAAPMDTKPNFPNTPSSEIATRVESNIGRIEESSASAPYVHAAAAVQRPPFQVSDSIIRRCDAQAAEGSSCWRMFKFLEEFSREDRDPDWAGRAAQMLRTYLTDTLHNQYALRSVECRKTLCALEVVATDAFASAEILMDPQLSRLLRPDIGDIGHEVGPDGQRLGSHVHKLQAAIAARCEHLRSG
jgi:hypothetical protein